jgi:hypothetical protein
MATTIRGSVGTLRAHFDENQPNLWAALMKFVCDLLILMFLFGNPFINYLHKLGPVQFYVIVFTAFQTIPWLCSSAIVSCLANPYIR